MLNYRTFSLSDLETMATTAETWLEENKKEKTVAARRLRIEALARYSAIKSAIAEKVEEAVLEATCLKV